MKIALPAGLVTSMDQSINASTAYASRQDFIADAIANLLADLAVEGAAPGPSTASPVVLDSPQASPSPSVAAEPTPSAEPAPVYTKEIEPLEVYLAEVLAEIPNVSSSGISAGPMTERLTEPIWGMHNRDYPTLWAAGLLSREMADGEPVTYHSWVATTAELAWRLRDSLSESAMDLSGFPANPDKPDKSEARFIRFFIGDDVGNGPLFDLGLASNPGNGTVTLTEPGLHLLAQLKGWSPRTDVEVKAEAREAFLRHLAVWVPEDFKLIRLVVEAIADGMADRDSLIAAMAEMYPSWIRNVGNTYVAGYIGRSREWGLLESRQQKRRYVVKSGALEALEAAASHAGGRN